jgi:hypothetical protein
VASRQERRRRRHIERRLRELDRLDSDHAAGAYPVARSRRAWDWRGVIALGVTLLLLAGMVHAVPALAPAWLRKTVGLEPHRLAPAVAVHTTGSYAFIAHQPHAPSDPVAWDPCKPIEYVINPTGSPADGIGVAEQAVSRMEQVSGLDFEYRGETDARPHWNSPVLPIIAVRKPVLISWASADEVPQLSGDLAGIGGSIPVAARGGRLRYATGGITLDAHAFAQLADQPEGQAEERAIILHELGHVVGLAHVADPAELMNADNLGLLDYGSGDLAGLARLGNGRCF